MTIVTSTRGATLIRGILVAALLGALIVLMGKGLGSVPYIAAVWTYPFQIDDAEGVILAEATLIRDGIDPYAHQPSPAPYFYAGPYPPVYTLINAAAIAAAGPTFKVGRAVQLFATLAVAAWLVWAVAGGQRGAGWAAWLVGTWAALLWLTAHLVTVWGVLVRPDMTALACTLGGVIVLRRYWHQSDQPEREWRTESWPRGRVLATLALGAACFALGWWTKQTFVAMPVALMLALCWRRPRTALTLAGLYGVMLAVPFLILTIVTRGGFAQKTVGYQGSWEWPAFWRLAAPFGQRYGLWLVVAIVTAAGCALRARRPPFAVLWFVLAGAAALGAGTSGGNHNHFVELLAAMALLTGQAVTPGLRSGQFSREPRVSARQALVPVGALAVIIMLTTGAAMEREGRYGWLAHEYTAPSANERAGTAAVAAYLTNAPAPVYSDNVGILVVARQPVRVTDPFTMAAEVRLGRWDDADLVADVAAGKFSVIAIRERELDPDHPPTDMTPALVRALLSRYRLAERNVLNLYVPK